MSRLEYDWADASLIRRTLQQSLLEWAEEAPDRPFLRWRDGDPKSFEEVLAASQSVTAGLEELGVGPGDTVLIMLDNSIEIVEAWFGVCFGGAVEVPVNVHDKGRFLRHIIADSQASVMIVESHYLERVAAVIDEVDTLDHVVVRGEQAPARLDGSVAVHRYDDLLRGDPAGSPVDVDHRDLMAVLYTSGTTGPAKGIMMTYGHAGLSAANLIEVMELDERDTYFVCMPLFHSNAQVIQVLPALMVGAEVSIWPEFTASRWLDQIRSVGATVSNTLGVMTEFIYGQEVREDDADNPLRRLQTIPLPAAIAEKFEKRFDVQCLDGYGLTDAGIISFRRPSEPLVPGSAGRPVPGYEVRVAEPETDEELPTGEIGEIQIRPSVPFGFMAGYWRNPEATVDAWRNLWFHTGDAGYLDADGLLYFHDRLKDAIRVRGENVSSSEVESVLFEHPAVADCAAIAVPAQHGDDEIKVCVVLEEQHDVSESDLIEFCRPRMPYFAVPRYVEFVTELPKTPTDKVRKVTLREIGITEATWDRKDHAVGSEAL